MDVKDIIRQARNEAGLLQRDLASRVGCSQQTVVDIESGRIKQSKYLAQICSELGLDFKALLSGKTAQAHIVAHDYGRAVPLINPADVGAFLADQLYVNPKGRHAPCPVPLSEGSFVLLASGDAMAPDIQHGDIVYVDPVANWLSGDILCVFIGTTRAPMFRRVFSEGGGHYAVAARDGARTDLRLVGRLSEIETSALNMIDVTLAFVAGRAILAMRELTDNR